MDIKEIKKIVDYEFNIDIKKNSRKTPYINGRFMYYKLCDKFTGASFENIGEKVNRSHSLVSIALSKESLYLDDKFKKKTYIKLTKICKKLKLSKKQKLSKWQEFLIIESLKHEISLLKELYKLAENKTPAEMNYDYNKTKTGLFNHRGIELLEGDIVSRGGTKDYLVLDTKIPNTGFILKNFADGDISFNFLDVSNFGHYKNPELEHLKDNDLKYLDNYFEIVGNIFDKPKLIKRIF